MCGSSETSIGGWVVGWVTELFSKCIEQANVVFNIQRERERIGMFGVVG